MKYVPEWFPGAEFKKQARIWHAAVDKLFNDPYNDCQKRLVSLSYMRLSGVNLTGAYRMPANWAIVRRSR